MNLRLRCTRSGSTVGTLAGSGVDWELFDAAGRAAAVVTAIGERAGAASYSRTGEVLIRVTNRT